MKRACICCNKPARDPHHPHPQAQGGTDEGTVPVCRDCHGLYHNICGQGLAKFVKARVRNFGIWMSKFPKHDMLGHAPGINPADMAPVFVREEAGHFILTQEYQDFSEGCLSTLGKVKTYPPRKRLKATMRGRKL